uniref:methylated-DNA--[protein]-cysteine S-methyltransferase n=1 Tax=Thermosporothrix sp. COM3 TaxID=2490863 RepID=A0A455SMC8_9CHLR|nr:bifunctional transcriptional activator/DNA repair enzyme protein Ada [Thermosporothrix sp. COM3]
MQAEAYRADQQERYWQAVQENDVRMNGVFVYAVKSTGIYCLPSCPSRLPRREHVAFFAGPEDAEREGFRPCRRCQPKRESAESEHIALVKRLCAYIQEHLEEPLTLSDLSEQAHMSPFHLQRVFKRVMGITPYQYVEASRMRYLKDRLKDGEQVTTALYEAGFSSPSRLYERSAAQMGMSPVVYSNGGKGMTISYTLVSSPLGRLLVAATERGICEVRIGENDEELLAGLRADYEAAQMQKDNVVLTEWVTVLLRHLEGQQPDLHLPVDVQATAFQWKVWKELLKIPYGETRSYGEIARALGDPKKARAVANACASNPVALVIPCHRVVRNNGAPGGYRWGIKRKQQLLDQERHHKDV